MRESTSTFLIWGLGQKAVAKKEEKDELSAFVAFWVTEGCFCSYKNQFSFKLWNIKRELDEAKHVSGKHSVKHCKDGGDSRIVAF